MTEIPGVTDETVYEVTYFNGVTEQVTGLAEVRRRIIDPTSRVADAQDIMQGATFREVES